ncbi:hypothetical protein BCR44DRAFT_146737 [Catenaria anguillulae PL171]|uniref:rhomboid protease n=1 Tax=Catenaria anguillulae PL171 TaxID=765915 RepID=A0A1Y2H6B4_9FUNG|nr:hypothetical protein BCR44DRAFT_146737 [Catenaria anguillulae PL171]
MPIQLPPDSTGPSSTANLATPSIGRSAFNLSRLTAWTHSIPLATRVYVGTITFAYVCSLVEGVALAATRTCYNPRTLVSLTGWLFALLAPIMHGGFWHWLFNALAALSLVSYQEKRLGSVAVMHLVVVVLPLVAAVVHGVVTFVVGLMFALSPECIVGCSGVLFALVVVYCHELKEAKLNVFGVVEVPAGVYPWILLVLVSVLVSGVTFWGHLAGMCAGYLYAFGLLNWAQFPSSLMDRLETSTSPRLRKVLDSDLYVPHEPSTALPRYASVPGASSPSGFDAPGRVLGGGGGGGLLLSDDEGVPSPGATLHDAGAAAGTAPFRLPSPRTGGVSSDSDSDGGSPLQLPGEGEKVEARLLI